MLPQTILQELEKKDNYTLELEKSQSSIKLNLQIKISKLRTEIFSWRLQSLKDKKNLENYFDDMDSFAEYIMDPNHWQLKLQQREFIIIERSPTRKNKITEIEVIPFQFIERVEKQKSEELINMIVERCNSKKQFKQDDIKNMFETIALCLQELVFDKKQRNELKKDVESLGRRIQVIENSFEQLQEECIKNNKLIEQLKKQSDIKIQESNLVVKKTEQKLESKILDEIQKHQKKLSQFYPEITKLKESFLDKLKQNTENKSNFEKMTGKLVQLSSKIERIQKQKEKSQIQNDSQKKVQQIILAKDWVDPECYYSIKDWLLIDKNNITNKRTIFSSVFGRKELKDKQSFTIQPINIVSSICVGISQTTQIKKDILDGNNTFYYPSHVNPGFKVGQKVTTILDVEKRQVKFYVDGKLVHTISNQKLKDPNLKWVPYIHFQRQKDSVMIVDK